MDGVTLLMPPLDQLGQHPRLSRWLGRGDRLPLMPAGRLPVLREQFGLAAGMIPAAALLREAAAGDAGDGTWVCADPVYIQPEAAGARLLAWDTLDLTMAEAESLARPLRPLLGDAGMLLETTLPGRWQVRMVTGTPLPLLADPEQVLGAQLLPHLPAGDVGRRWRLLFNEIQILLHQHPLNRQRADRGRLPINALWFWGGGRLPARPRRAPSGVFSDDPLMTALAWHAGSHRLPSPHPIAGRSSSLVDLASAGPEEALRALAAWHARMHWREGLHLAFVDGHRWRLARAQVLRVWRRAWRG